MFNVQCSDCAAAGAHCIAVVMRHHGGACVGVMFIDKVVELVRVSYCWLLSIMW